MLGQCLFYIWVLGMRKTHLEWRNEETTIKKICIVGLGRPKVTSSLATFMGKSEVCIDHKNLTKLQQINFVVHVKIISDPLDNLPAHEIITWSQPHFQSSCRFHLKVDIAKSSSSAYAFFHWFKSQTLVLLLTTFSSTRHYQYVWLPEK